jgi:hypothetical protein
MGAGNRYDTSSGAPRTAWSHPMNAAAETYPPFASVTYRDRSYTVIWFEHSTFVSVEYSRWAGLGQIQTTRTVKRGPTRDAVLALAAKETAK